MDNYGIYMARVVAGAVASDLFNKDTASDSRLTVRIIPHMKDVEDGLLPRYPFFFRDGMLSGEVDELVWVVCSDDFSVGYILGSANYNTYHDLGFNKFTDGEGEESQVSVGGDLKRALRSSWVQRFGLDSPDFANMKVTYWNDDCLHFINRENGGSYIMYSNGNMHIMEPNRFLVVVGASTISIDKDGIEIVNASTDGTIAVQANDVALGLAPQGKALATGGTGETVIPSDHVRV